MKKITFLTIALACLCGKSFANDLVINMTEEAGVKIVSTGVFDIINCCVGYTDFGTTLDLGEVDFGDGTKYAGVSVLQAQQATDLEGYLDFYLGDPDNGGYLINDVLCKNTKAWQLYKTYSYDFYPEGSDVRRPTGKGHVFCRFRNNDNGDGYYCNLKRVTFYEKELGEEGMGLQPDPVYNYQSYLAKNMEIVDKAGTDVHLNTNDQLGWTDTGVTAKITGADFGTGQYGQVAILMSHSSTSTKVRLLIYVDEVKDENLIANVWTGRDFSDSFGDWTNFDYSADDMTKTVTGTHDIYVVWNEPSDVKELRLCEGHPYEVEYGHEWVDNKSSEPQPEVVTLTDEAYTMTFDNIGGIENTTDIVVKGTADGGAGARYESANIGYTSNGVIVRFNDVDFQNGQFGRIVVESSTDQSAMAHSSFDFYLDIPKDADFTNADLLNDYTMIASVEAPATDGWSNHQLTAGNLTEKVSGVHDLYMVWNVTNGCNVFAVSLDVIPGSGDGIDTVNANVADGKIYNISGQRVNNNYKGVVINNGKKYMVK